MDIFFCDIAGTFTGQKENRDKSLKKFVSNLSRLLKQSKSDKMLFCFISSDTIEKVMKNTNELKKYLNDSNIELGNQYSFEQSFKYKEKPTDCVKGKTSQIFSYLAEQKNVNNVYFADDTEIYHEMISYIHSVKSDLADNIIHFVPGIKNDSNLYNVINKDNLFTSKGKDINGVNECIEKRLSIKNKVKQK